MEGLFFNTTDYNHHPQIIYHSIDLPNSWVCIFFKLHKVKISHYSIQTHGFNNDLMPKNWVVEGSNDSNDWFILDRRPNDESFHVSAASNTFEVQNEENKNRYYRYLRIRQYGLNSSDSNYFW